MPASADAVALFAELSSRVATQTLLEHSRQHDPTNLAVDTDWLAYQAQDAIARFELETGLAWDGTNARHVALGVDLTLHAAYTRVRNHARADEQWSRIAPALTALRGKRRVAPIVDDVTDQFEPVVPSDERRRDFDPLDAPWTGFRSAPVDEQPPSDSPTEP